MALACIKMMVFKRCLLLLFVFTASINGYQRPSEFDPYLWDALTPYFLPEDHLLKDKLDRIFSNTRPTQNAGTLKKAGFKRTTPGKYSNLIVTRHKKIKGYLFKLFLDNQDCHEWPALKHRIDGALSLAQAIDGYGYTRYFKVPKKWLYPLPPLSHSIEGCQKQKYFILVVEDAVILEGSVNESCWKNRTLVTPEFLSAFKKIVQHEGLHDSVLPFNAPFSIDGKVAFIDMERHHVWPIYWNRLTPYLSKEMRAYWQEL